MTGYPDIWPDISLGISVKVFLERLTCKFVGLSGSRWFSIILIQSVEDDAEQKDWAPQRQTRIPQSPAFELHLWHQFFWLCGKQLQIKTKYWFSGVFSLPACPADFRLANLQGHMSQFAIIYLFLHLHVIGSASPVSRQIQTPICQQCLILHIRVWKPMDIKSFIQCQHFNGKVGLETKALESWNDPFKNYTIAPTITNHHLSCIYLKIG